MTNYDQIVYNTAREEGFTDIVAKMIAAQARLESSNYTSRVFVCNNNMFGMKYAGQALAKRGTLAPSNEISTGCSVSGTDCNRTGIGNCRDKDFYAKYDSPEDSIKDTIQRLFKISRNGIGFDELNATTDTTSYATALKKRDYYGFIKYGSPGSEDEINKYAAGLRSRLSKVSITEWVKDTYRNNQKPINFAVIGIIIISLTGYIYYLNKKRILK